MIEQIYEILTDTTNPGSSGSKSNGNRGQFHISQSSRTGASPSDAGLCHTQDTCWGGVLPLDR